MHNFIRTVFICLACLSVSQVHAFKFGVIGDSLSTAANTEDDCSGTLECVEAVGTSSEFSFAHGDQSWSLFNRLMTIEPGLNGVLAAAENGARWDDALDQATILAADSDVEIVHIELGGNDVCAETKPTLDELNGHISDTFTLLGNSGSVRIVIVSEAPDVVDTWEVNHARPNFLFETFQDLWDVNPDKLNIGLPGSVVAVIADFFADIGDDPLFCGPVLSSESTMIIRDDRRQLNEDLNELIVAKVLEFDGLNGTRFILADGLAETELTTDWLSELDGFHLGKVGQEMLADLIWSSIEPQLVPTTTTTTTTTTVAATSTTTIAATTTTTVAATSTTTVAATTTTAGGSDTTTTSTAVTVTTTTTLAGIGDPDDNVIPVNGAAGSDTLVSDAGILGLGSSAIAAGGTGVGVNAGDITDSGGGVAVDGDVQQSCIGGCFDFTVSGLAVGGTVQVVLPLSAQIPANAVYRKFVNNAWKNFDTSGANAVASSNRGSGDCPAPASGSWTNGLTAGDDCVRLTIVDGGPNDADGVANGVVVDPGGVAQGLPVDNGNDDFFGCSASPAAPGPGADFFVLAGFLIWLRLWRASASVRATDYFCASASR